MLAYSGRDVTLVNQQAKLDANGDPQRHPDHGDVRWASEQTRQVKAEIVYRGTPRFERLASGVDEEIMMLCWVSDEHADAFTSGDDSETVRATRVVDGQARYVVRNVMDEVNGLMLGQGAMED